MTSTGTARAGGARRPARGSPARSRREGSSGDVSREAPRRPRGASSRRVSRWVARLSRSSSFITLGRAGVVRRLRRWRVVALLRLAGRAGDEPAGIPIGVDEAEPVLADDELADLVRVRRASRLANADGPVSLACHLEAVEHDPGVDQRRDPRIVSAPVAPPSSAELVVRAGEERGDALGLEVVHEASHHRADLVPAADHGEIGDRIEDDHRGLELLDLLVNREEVRLEAEARGPRGDDPEQSSFTRLARSSPIELMLRTSCAGDSSNEK